MTNELKELLKSGELVNVRFGKENGMGGINWSNWQQAKVFVQLDKKDIPCVIAFNDTKGNPLANAPEHDPRRKGEAEIFSRDGKQFVSLLAENLYTEVEVPEHVVSFDAPKPKTKPKNNWLANKIEERKGKLALTAAEKAQDKSNRAVVIDTKSIQMLSLFAKREADGRYRLESGTVLDGPPKFVYLTNKEYALGGVNTTNEGAWWDYREAQESDHIQYRFLG